MGFRRKLGERSACRTCGQDIEWSGRAYGWTDRGGNRSCVTWLDRGEVKHPPKGGKHRPVTRLVPESDIPSYAVIIRCIHFRGETQRAALAELDRRGLWLSPEQRKQAELDT